jgi:hypothetical protein
MKRALLAAAFLISAQGAAAQNLVTNGDFSLGNVGFTSDYVYSPVTNNGGAEYTVRTDPFPWNPNFVSVTDHTTGTGFMMVGNGSPTAGEVVWQSTPITIDAATNYFFEAYVMNVCCNANYGGGNSSPVLTFSVSLDGGPANDLQTLTIPLTPAGVWYGLSTSFNSGGATSATLSLINANTELAGNDFALDDVFLGTQSSVVPEPATWAMMLVGFGGIGFQMRRKRAVLARAA